MAQTEQLVFTLFFTPNLSYDQFQGFVPISFLAKAPVIVAVNPNVPAQTLSELLAFAPSKRGSLHYATTGIGKLKEPEIAQTLYARIEADRFVSGGNLGGNAQRNTSAGAT